MGEGSQCCIFLFIWVFAPDYFLRVMGWRERSLMSPLR